MLMSKPTALELVSTTVTDATPVYDPSGAYADGDLVKKDDGIYSVSVETKVEATNAFDNKTTTLNGTLVSYNGSAYQANVDQYITPDDSNTEIKRSIFGPNLYGLPTLYKVYGVWEGDGSSFTFGTTAAFPEKLVRYTFDLTNSSTNTYDMTEDYVTDNGDGTETITSTTTTSVVINDAWSVDFVLEDLFLFGGSLYEVFQAEIKILAPDEPYQLTSGQAYAFDIYLLESYNVYTLDYMYPVRTNLPLDSKQYTSVIEAGPQTWVVKSLSTFDTVAIGRLKGDTVTVVFKDSTGTEITRHDDMTIDGRIDVDGRLPYTYTTMILYADTDIDANGTIEITVNGASTEVGMIKAGLSIDLGFTNLEFKNNGKDYSPKQQSAISGYIDYIEGVKVMVHKGSIDVPVERYDITSRFIRDFLGSLMIINGSDAKNTAPDNQGIFSSTQLIARISSMDMGTKIKDGDIEPMVPIPFVCEEIV